MNLEDAITIVAGALERPDARGNVTVPAHALLAIITDREHVVNENTSLLAAYEKLAPRSRVKRLAEAWFDLYVDMRDGHYMSPTNELRPMGKQEACNELARLAGRTPRAMQKALTRERQARRDAGELCEIELPGNPDK